MVSHRSKSGLPARAAAIRGDDYHHAVAWLWVSKMLCTPARILSVSVEDREGGAFDDVVVRQSVGENIYIQAKSSNYGHNIVDRDWLLTAATAGGKSPLQRFHDTYLRLSKAGERFRLELWTNRGFDHANPLLGRLLDKRLDKIETGRMLGEGQQSAVGKERDTWAAHLGVDAENLALFLDAMRWRHTASENEVLEQARPHMKLVGLRDDGGALTTGMGIIRGWSKDGLGPQTPADAGHQVAAMRLTAADPLVVSSRSDNQSTEPGLPPACREGIKELRTSAPTDADRVADLLSRKSSLVPGVLAYLVSEPLDWMINADSRIWDSMVDFARAHELPGEMQMRERAIAAGSPKSVLHRFRVGVAAAARGAVDRVEEMLGGVPHDHPLVGAVRAHIDNDADAVIRSIMESKLHESDDPDLAFHSCELLGWAYWHLGELESADMVLQFASERFPGRGFLLLQQARIRLKLAQQNEDQGSQRHDLLESAVESAIRARDEFRQWGGLSARAVSLAADALLTLDQPQRACQVTMLHPKGEAEPHEAEDAWVVASLAHALLMLGRVEELDELSLELVGGAEELLIRALQARSRGDSNARDLMRTAIEEAGDDWALLRALEGLALLGETDEAALSRLDGADEAEANRIRASAAYHAGNYDSALDLLMPYRCHSADHAELLAACQRESDGLDAACETLLECGEALDDLQLLSSAVRLLVAAEKYEKAEDVATRALARNPSRFVESRLCRSLVEVAESLEDWSAMEQYGREFFRRFPELHLGQWAVVYALHRQARYREAWGYLVAHDLSPDNEDAALLAVDVYVAMGVPAHDVERLLRIARLYPSSEEVTGNAIGALIIGKGGDVGFSDAQIAEIRDLVAGFEERYPDSSVLRRHSFDSEEQLLDALKDKTQQRSLDIDPLLRDVRDGRMPYGMLRAVAPVPYAESLQLRAAGYLTAISSDAATRQRERTTAREAIGEPVAVDTSVAVLGMLADINLNRIGAVFSQVLVADELLADARAAVTSAGTPAAAYVGYEPLVGDVVFSTVEEEELKQAVEAAQQVVDMLKKWQRVPSSRIRLEGRSPHPAFQTWDSSIRVASNRGCALWSDDIAMRHYAELAGIATFGTYALYEVLVLEADGGWLPASRDLKLRLLRARIADVPLTLQELREATEQRTAIDAVAKYLGRPFSWNDPSTMFDSYLGLVDMLQAAYPEDVPAVLFEASCGLGSVVEPAARQDALGRILAATLWTVSDEAMTPVLVTCSRYAARRIDPVADVDPLPAAVKALLEFLVNELDAGVAAQTVISIFSQAETADRLTVESLVG